MVSRAIRGVGRSLRIYHGHAAPREAMDRLYGRFVSAGDLVFDIGAHVGDRVSSFRRIGAKVVAIEPQPRLMRALRLIHSRDPEVSLEQVAVGARSGIAVCHINTDNPTVSTLSETFMARARNASGWVGQIWDDRFVVDVTTLDDLIDKYGQPTFIKIDVEGSEADVLAGLSHGIPALSFEFTTIERGVAMEALRFLERLGDYRCAYAIGESQCLNDDGALSADAMRAQLERFPDDVNSGDIFAWLPDHVSPFADDRTSRA